MAETSLQRHLRYLRNKIKENEFSKNYQLNHRKERTEYFRKYRQTKKGKENVLKAIQKYEKAHPIRRIAWNKAQILDKKPCIKCGNEAHRHHPNPKISLEIIFLCPLHHKEEHSRMI